MASRGGSVHQEPARRTLKTWPCSTHSREPSLSNRARTRPMSRQSSSHTTPGAISGSSIARMSTAQVCEAAGISSATALRWSRAGLLPPYERIHGGKRGQYAR